jgi:hypothetical protein
MFLCSQPHSDPRRYAGRRLNVPAAVHRSFLMDPARRKIDVFQSFVGTCRTSSPSNLRLQAVLQSVKNADHGPIRALAGYSFIWSMRGGIGFIRVLGSGEYFPRTCYSDTHPRSWLKRLGENGGANCVALSSLLGLRLVLLGSVSLDRSALLSSTN